MRLFVGIDPGLDGAAAVLAESGEEVAYFRMPVVKGKRRKVDGRALARALREAGRTLGDSVALVVVEEVHSMPRQGIAGAFSFGCGLGRVLGVVEALGLPLEMAGPQAWKRAILAGTDKSKEAAVSYCLGRWPGIELPERGAARHGIAEAACLAEFGRRLVLGGKAAGG